MAVECYCALLDSLKHFNFRSNILKIVVGKLTSSNIKIQRMAHKAFYHLLGQRDNSILDFKLEAVKYLRH